MVAEHHENAGEAWGTVAAIARGALGAQMRHPPAAVRKPQSTAPSWRRWTSLETTKTGLVFDVRHAKELAV